MMNLPIGKLFYFVPRIQGYNPAGTGNEHYAPIGAPNGPTAGGTGNSGPGAGYPDNAGAFGKNLYDLFYEGAEAGLDPPGLFDYSKGRWSAVTASTTLQAWSSGSLVDATVAGGVPAGGVQIAAGNQRKLLRLTPARRAATSQLFPRLPLFYILFTWIFFAKFFCLISV